MVGSTTLKADEKNMREIKLDGMKTGNQKTGDHKPGDHKTDQYPDVNKKSIEIKIQETGVTKGVDVDEALELGGPCGRFQFLTQAFFMYMVLTIGYQVVFTYFIASDPPWTCAGHIGTLHNTTSLTDTLHNNTSLTDTPHNTTSLNTTTSKFCREHQDVIFSTDSEFFYERCKLNRWEWKYTTTKDYSFVTEYDLVCKKASTAALASSMFYIGGLIGSIVSGIVADTYGRKMVLLTSLSGTICLSIVCSFTKNVWQLTVVRGFLGAAQMTCYSIAFIILSEFISPSYRTISANMFQLNLCLSQLVIDISSYFDRTWRSLQIYATLPALLALAYFFTLPESPRWLLSANKKEEAEKVLEKIAKFNGRPLTIHLRESNEDKSRMYTYIDLFRSWKLSLQTIAQCTIWATVALVYYAIALESANLGGNMYQAFALSALADLPSNFAAFWACNRLGRKKAVLGSLFICGIFIGSLALVPHHKSYTYLLNISLVMIAKFMIDLAFNGIFIWTFEIYPTCLRSQGWAVCVVLERVGALCVPFLTTVLQRVSHRLPFVVMAICSVAASLVGLILPETNKMPTRETYDDFRNSKSDKSVSVAYDNKALDVEK